MNGDHQVNSMTGTEKEKETRPTCYKIHDEQQLHFVVVQQSQKQSG